jgi:hypothetical protein
VVLPLPVVVFLKVTVSGYDPSAREFAALLREIATVAVCPGVSCPDAGEIVSQLAVLDAVQFKVCVGCWFLTVYVRLAGLNGPPAAPPKLTPVVGLTMIAGCTVSVTDLVQLPFPLVRLVKVRSPE